MFPKVGGTWPTTSPSELTASDGAPYDCFGYQGLTAISSRVIAVGASTLNGNLYFFEKNYGPRACSGAGHPGTPVQTDAVRHGARGAA